MRPNLELDEALTRALDADRRAAALLSVAGAFAQSPHGWGDDPASWVRAQWRTGRSPSS